MQEQTLVQKQNWDRRQEQATLFKDPFVVCFLISPKVLSTRYVYWYAYSAGKTKNLFWGYYTPKTQKTKIKGVCGYTARMLSAYIEERREQGYVPVAQWAINRHHQQMMRNLSIREQNTSDLNPFFAETYRQNKRILDFMAVVSSKVMDHVQYSAYIGTKPPIQCVPIDKALEKCLDSREKKNPNCQQWYYGLDPYKKKSFSSSRGTLSNNRSPSIL